MILPPIDRVWLAKQLADISRPNERTLVRAGMTDRAIEIEVARRVPKMVERSGCSPENAASAALDKLRTDRARALRIVNRYLKAVGKVLNVRLVD